MMSVMNAVTAIRAQEAEIILAGGMEAMSQTWGGDNPPETHS